MNIFAPLLVGLRNINFLEIMNRHPDVTSDNLHIDNNLLVFVTSQRVLVLFMGRQ